MGVNAILEAIKTLQIVEEYGLIPECGAGDDRK
jgi:hypothetical protein